MDIKIVDIKIKERRRSVNVDKVRALAESIDQNGLINPITLDGDYNLLAGLHRVEAFKLLRRETIPASVKAGLDALEAELIEIDENLIRNDLTPLQAGEWLIRRDKVLDEMGLRAKASPGTNQYTNMVGGMIPPTKSTKDIAQEIGVSKSTALKHKQIARDIIPEVKEQIYGTELEERTTDLLTIARMKPEEQRETVSRFKASGARSLNGIQYNGQGQTGLSQPMQIMLSHRSVEYYTPVHIVEAARRVMGGIDLDPASCEDANKVVKAKTYYTIEDDGYNKDWHGRVWINPPYAKTDGQSNQERWALKLLQEYDKGNIIEGLILVKSALGYKWFENLWDLMPVCFLRERLSFTKDDGTSEGESKHGTAIFYKGNDVDKFIIVFSYLGRITVPGGQYIE